VTADRPVYPAASVSQATFARLGNFISIGAAATIAEVE
jgi:hypothetical protein